MLTGLSDTGDCCNMGWLNYHQAIAKQCPELVEEFIELEKERYKTINIGGLKQDRVTLTHMIKCATPFAEEKACKTV